MESTEENNRILWEGVACQRLVEGSVNKITCTIKPNDRRARSITFVADEVDQYAEQLTNPFNSFQLVISIESKVEGLEHPLRAIRFLNSPHFLEEGLTPCALVEGEVYALKRTISNRIWSGRHAQSDKAFQKVFAEMSDGYL
jgi:hypothetical protein